MKAIIATTVFGVIMMFAGLMVDNKKTVTSIAAVLFLALLGVNNYELYTTSTNTAEMVFGQMLRLDHLSIWFNTLMTGCTLLYVLLIG